MIKTPAKIEFQRKRDAHSGRPFSISGMTGCLFRGDDLRQRDSLLAVLLGDDAFGFHLLGVLADVLVKRLRDIVVVREDRFLLSVGTGDGDRGLALSRGFQVALGADGFAFDFGFRGERRNGEGCEDGREEREFLHNGGWLFVEAG